MKHNWKNSWKGKGCRERQRPRGTEKEERKRIRVTETYFLTSSRGKEKQSSDMKVSVHRFTGDGSRGLRVAHAACLTQMERYGGAQTTAR